MDRGSPTSNREKLLSSGSFHDDPERLHNEDIANESEYEDDESLQSLPSKDDSLLETSTTRLIQEGRSAAIEAAEKNHDTDSVLSEDEDGNDLIESPINQSVLRIKPPPDIEDFRRMSAATFQFIQDSSIERPLSIIQRSSSGSNLIQTQSNFTTESSNERSIDEFDSSFQRLDVMEDSFVATEHKNNQSWDEVLVETQSAGSSLCENSQNQTSIGESEQGRFSDCYSTFEDHQPQHMRLSSGTSSVIDLINDDLSVDSMSVTSCTESVTEDPPTKAECTSFREIKTALFTAGVLDENDVEALEKLRQQWKLDPPDDDALLLYYLFSSFSTPFIGVESAQRIIEMERNGLYTNQSVVLPKDAMVNVVEKSIIYSIILFHDQRLLLKLPKPFVLAFFRILIRLLTNETDEEYNEQCLLTCQWKGDVLQKTSGTCEDAAVRLQTAAQSCNVGLTGPQTFKEKSSFPKDGEGAYTNATTDSQIYTMVRFQQCGTKFEQAPSGSDRHAARKLLRLFDRIKHRKEYRHLLAPVARLLGLICISGVSERVLRRMLTLASTPITSSPSELPLVGRLLLVRALQACTIGSSRSIFFKGKTSLSHFFSFGGGTGLVRTISGLAAWPFRNDFGMAIWFRAESFEQGGDKKNPILLSVRAEDGGGIEISIMPLIENGTADASSSAAVIVVSIFDSDPDGMEETEVQRVRVPGCILLPRVWYHLSVRHTRSRMKGVFSLSTRQQVTILLDGKLMLTEPLSFPKVSDEDFQSDNKATSFLQKAVRRSTSRSGLTLKVSLGSNFEGQTGSLYLFHGNVSDATFRAIHEVGAGTAGTVVKANDRNSGWDSRRGDIVRKSRLLDVGIKRDDVEEIVVSQRRHSTGDLVLDWIPASSGNFAVLDLGEGDDQETFELPNDLSRSAFASKLFLVWDPCRTVANMALDLHIGAHVKLADGGVQAWQVDGAQDVIGSLGGVQALIPIFQSLLCGDVEKLFLDETAPKNRTTQLKEVGAFGNEPLWSTIPDLLCLLASFVQDHGENARELLRCGGVDVIENCLLTSRKVALNSSALETSLFGPLTAFPKLSYLLIESLLKLRKAGAHYLGLETKLFSRLLFNTTLWFSGSDHSLFVALDLSLLPVLSSLARGNPDKVRDCVGIRDLVFLLKASVDCDASECSKLQSRWKGPLTIFERRHFCDVLLGIVFEVLRSGTEPRDFSPFLDLLSYNLDSEWDESSQEMGERDQIRRAGNRRERYMMAVKSCTMLLLLLQMKPGVSNLVESFAHCCGSVEGAAGWILCAMVNSFDDTIRSIGVRCVKAFIEKTALSPDSPLSISTNPEPEGAHPSLTEGSNARRIQTIIAVGKGLAGMGSSVRSIVLPPSRLTARVAYKLLWHLLKGHRARLGKKTYSALIYLAVDDSATQDSLPKSKKLIVDHYIDYQDSLVCGYRINDGYLERTLDESCIPSGSSLREGLGISTVMRLLRFLSNEMKERLLSDLLKLARDDSSSVAKLSSLQDWQACLFHLTAETLEKCKAGKSNNGEAAVFNVANATLLDDQRTEKSSRIFESLGTIEKRLDLCLDLYSTLLGYCVREGGDKALHSVEDAASLQRVCVNGQAVFCLILSRLLGHLAEFGTMLESHGDQSDTVEDPLKRSARLVTDAILSSGTEGLDMKSAARCWRSLRHLSVISVALLTKTGFGVAELFDSSDLRASVVDRISGGLFGIRLPDTGTPAITAQEYCIVVEEVATNLRMGLEAKEREICCHVAVTLASQVLSLLDAFIFPDSLDASLPQSQIHGLDLVRNCEQRFTAQGPLIASAIRLSLLLLCYLEPCGMKLLQCTSRLRCLLHWALELIREAAALEGYSAAFHKLTAPLDRLILAIVLQCHQALGRCSALLSEIESTSFSKYFQSRDSQKKYYRRILRVSLEIRDVVSAAFRGRNDVLRAALSGSAFDALRESLETPTSLENKNISKESLARSFLMSKWVTGYQGVVVRSSHVLPEQIDIGAGIQTSSATPRGVIAIRELHDESAMISNEFEKALNNCFQKYLQAERKWAETDLVRDLEYQGDETVKRLAAKHRTDLMEANQATLLRSLGALSRLQGIERKVTELWSREAHWKLARHTDRLGQRILLVRNRRFKNHEEASYELMLGKEREQEEKAREERLRQNEQLAEVMRRNTEAIVPYDASQFGGGDEDEFGQVNDSDTESMDLTEQSGDEDKDCDLLDGKRVSTNSMPEEDWDKIEAEDVEDDDWAKAFIWSDFESVVARFESVMIVTLQSLFEGKLLLTTHGLYFRQIGDEVSAMSREASANMEANRALVTEENDRRWRLSRLTEVMGRRYMLRAQALELFFSDSNELFLNFTGGTKERDRFHAKLRNSCKTPMLRSLKSLNPRTVFKRSRLSELWRQRKISNFQYLMELNKVAGRTFNDIMQYPVFPWVLSDYTSEKIDLNDSRVYRDLTKPIGALNPDRLAQLLERYNEFADFGLPEQERFLYGSHYSSPGVVLHFMIRQEPFTSMAIELQSGRFDCPDRLFFDISESWKSCLTLSSDMKELVPEFFTLPEMFVNTNQFPLGKTQSGRNIDNVGLPPWAHGSPYEFVRIHRMALESEYVSNNLHNWIDLVFGYKQRGPESEAAHNVFHYLSYEGAVDLDKITNDVDRAAAESQIQNFGQTPSQVLVKEAHPSRQSADECWKPLIYNFSVAKRLRCYTPSKQFAVQNNTQGHRSAATKIHVFSDSVAVVYADLTVGTYKWSPTSTRGRLKADKLRRVARSELSRSRSVIKRGSAVPQSSSLGIGNWSFAFTIGGKAKEELRQKAVMSSHRLMTSKTEGLSAVEASGYLVSCGFWDNEMKVHSLSGYRFLCGDNGGHRGPIRCLAVGQDGGLLVSGGQDGTCRIWVVDHQDMATALSDGYVQTALGSTNDGMQLLSCCRVLWGHDSAINCVDLSSDLDVTVSGDNCGVVCVHTLRRGEYIRSFRPPPLASKPTSVSKISLHRHGNLVVHMQDCGLHTFTVNGVRLCTKDAGEKLHDMSICSNGEVLVTGGYRCHVIIRSVYNLDILSMLDLSRHGPIRCISLTPVELNPIPQTMFIGSDDGMVTIVEEDPNYGDENAAADTLAL